MHKKGDAPAPTAPFGLPTGGLGAGNQSVRGNYRLRPFWMLISVLKQTGSR